MNASSGGWWENWRSRHQSRVSLWLHLSGIPMTLAAVGLFIAQCVQEGRSLSFVPPLMFAFGYFLQFLGHMHEGNDMGEVILIKRLLGKPYVAVSPRYRKT